MWISRSVFGFARLSGRGPAGPSPEALAWPLAVGGICLVSLLVGILYWSGVRIAVSLWLSASAYNHSLLILPVFVFMLWSGRAELGGLSPRPTLWGGALIAVFSLLWLFSTLSGVAEGGHFAIIGLIQGVLLSVLGGRLYLRLLVPFCYLWLLVPSGEFMVPLLQAVTAWAATVLLELVGIATFRDNLIIEVASGAYVVAPGCAGLNFVLAALATALAYAQLVYRSWGRRVVFVLALLALAVAGNAVRVFLIIAVAHVLDDVGDIADDHILYGWAFFSLLLLGGMALGLRFRQDHGSGETPPPQVPASPETIVTATLGAALLVSVAPALLWGLWSDDRRAATLLPVLSCGTLDVVATGPEWPRSVGQVDTLAAIDCAWADRNVHLAVAGLDRPLRLGKLVGVERWVGAGEGWSRMARRLTTVRMDGVSIPVQEDLEANGHRRRLIWSLFWADDGWRRPGWDVAMADLRADVAGRRGAIVVLVSTSADDGEAAAQGALRTFLSGQRLDFNAFSERGH
jgi:exosortase